MRDPSRRYCAMSCQAALLPEQGLCKPRAAARPARPLRCKLAPTTPPPCARRSPCCTCSRCTGYRPILDAFKAFAKADAAAYTEEAIAASMAASSNGGAAAPAAGGSSNGAANGGGSSDGANRASNGHGGGTMQQRVCPSTGRPCDCAAGELDPASGTITSASKHKGEACGPLTHTRPAGGPGCRAWAAGAA